MAQRCINVSHVGQRGDEGSSDDVKETFPFWKGSQGRGIAAMSSDSDQQLVGSARYQKEEENIENRTIVRFPALFFQDEAKL